MPPEGISLVTYPESDNVFAIFEYQKNGGAWTSIGNGSTVASGSPSTLSWNPTLLGPSGSYKVRAKAQDISGLQSAYTTMSGTFTVNNPAIFGD